jgi:AsmA family protein
MRLAAMASNLADRLRHDRRIHIAAAVIVGLVLSLLLLLAAFPWGLLKGTIEDRLSRRFGRTVTIASMERVDHFGFRPVIALKGVRIPGLAWAGPTDLARIENAQIGFLALPLLRGRFKARDVTLSGVRLSLVRTKDGRRSWGETQERRGPGGRVLDQLTVADSRIVYRDLKAGRSFDVAMTSDSARGLRIAGNGLIRDVPVKVTATAPAIAGGNDGAWPFTVALLGDTLKMRAKGVMDRPLSTDAMTLDVTAEAADLKLIDAVIEAGLFRTQPVVLSAHIRRDADVWNITRLNGRIGRSDLDGRLTVKKEDGRTKLDGDIVSRQLDFDDLASDEGLAEAAAKKRATGPRIVPDTRVNIGKIGKTDGRIAFTVGRIVSRHDPSSLTAAKGAFTLDHQLLTVSPLMLGLRQGTITGRAVVDQRRGVRVPKVTLDLRLNRSSIGALAGGGGSVTGRVDARAMLVGRGSTLRQAIAASDGRIGLAARDGSLPAKIADALGFDVGRALTADKDERAVLRCVIVGLDVRGGRGRVDPMVLDTSASQMRGEGTIVFPDEALAIRLTGAPKRQSILRLPGSATMAGTISQPDIVVPKEVKSVGNFFKAIGRAITGKQGPTASDADCAGLGAQVLR